MQKFKKLSMMVTLTLVAALITGCTFIEGIFGTGGTPAVRVNPASITQVVFTEGEPFDLNTIQVQFSSNGRTNWVAADVSHIAIHPSGPLSYGTNQIVITYRGSYQVNHAIVVHRDGGAVPCPPDCDLACCQDNGGQPVVVPVNSVTIQGPVAVRPGSNAQFSVNIQPHNATDATVTWSVSSGATITQDGIFYSNTLATFTITATAGGISNTFTVEVRNILVEATGVSLNRRFLAMQRGTTTHTRAMQGVGTGVATARGEGARGVDNLIASVVPADADNQDIIFASLNPAIATVSPDGVISAHQVGIATITASAAGTAFSQSVRVEVLHRDNWTLTFSDEFDGQELDSANWRHQRGTGRLDRDSGANYGLTGWGNHEQQYYQPQNTSIVHTGDDSFMRITARREMTTASGAILPYYGFMQGGTWRQTLQSGRRYYTSSRIRSAGNFAQRFGRFEAMIRFDAIRGFWPAFWLMPEPPGNLGNAVAGRTQGVYGGWPHSGEIDIMEGVGSQATVATAAIHLAYGGHHAYLHRSPTYHITGGGRIDDWVLYATEWCPERIVFFVNDRRIMEVPRAHWAHGPGNRAGAYMVRGGSNYWRNLPNLATQHPQGSPSAPFDQEFHMILNLAVGGWFDNHATPPAGFTEGNKDVQFVRVWQRNDLFDWTRP